MQKLVSFRFQVLFLLASIIIGIYILVTMPDSSRVPGSVFVQSGLIINEATDQPFTGKVIDTVANQIVSYDVIDGIKNGEFNICLLNGNQMVSGEIVNNKNEGKWFYYYKNGHLESEGYFKNDVVVDKWTWYYPNGNKKEEGTYVDGKRDGAWKLYNDNGSLKSTVFFQDGSIINSFSTKPPLAS